MRNLETASTVDLNERFWPHLFHLSNQGTLVNDWHKTVHIVSVFFLFFFGLFLSFIHYLHPPFIFYFYPECIFLLILYPTFFFFFDQIIILHLTTEHWYFKLKKLKKKHTETFLSQFHAINSFFFTSIFNLFLSPCFSNTIISLRRITLWICSSKNIVFLSNPWLFGRLTFFNHFHFPSISIFFISPPSMSNWA